jgi:hypothetical protein
MTSAPANPFTELGRDVSKALVWLGAADGSTPAKDGETQSLQLVRLVRSAGARSLDYAQLAVDLGRDGSRLVDLQTPQAWRRWIEIRTADDDGEPVGAALFRGELGGQTIGISGPGREEAASVDARLERWHFGRLLTGMRVRDPVSEAVVKIDMDPVFNPVIDGRVIANRSTHRDPDHDYYLWAHPEAIRTAAAKTFQGETSPQSWTLPGIVFSLCWSLNGDETHIKNPTREELQAVMGFPADDWRPSTGYTSGDRVENGGNIYTCSITGVSAASGGPSGEGSAIADGTVTWAFESAAPNTPKVANLTIRRGAYLPDLLDAVLIPHGFGWFTQLSFDEPDEESDDPPAMRAKIVLFRRGEGEEREIFLQRPGEDLDLAKSNMPDLSMQTSVAELANVVQAFGGYEEREVTIELSRGWSESEDAYTVDDLDKDDLDSQYAAHPKAWRLWVGNEAGDYTGTRTVVQPITAPLDLSGVFTLWVNHRRKVEDCLTFDATGLKRRPPHVQWFDPQEGVSGEWKTVQPGSYTVLEDQIGVLFTGQKPPDDIRFAGADGDGAEVKLRITGTVAGDARLFREATRRAVSPNGNDVVVMLDVSDRFHDRQVQTTGDYASVLPDTYGKDDRDDGDDLEEYVGMVQDVEDCARIHAAFRLHGICLEYELGQLITRVAGRNISFNRLAEASEEKRYLQITAIEYHWQQQTTVLHVEAIDDEGFERDASFGEVTKKRWRNRKRKGRR